MYNPLAGWCYTPNTAGKKDRSARVQLSPFRFKVGSWNSISLSFVSFPSRPLRRSEARARAYLEKSVGSVLRIGVYRSTLRVPMMMR